MKISKEDYKLIDKAIHVALDNVNKTLTTARDFYIVRGLSDKRYRWDLFWASKLHLNDVWRNMAKRGNYNDEHLDTVLKKITKTT